MSRNSSQAALGLTRAESMAKRTFSACDCNGFEKRRKIILTKDLTWKLIPIFREAKYVCVFIML